MFRSTAPITKPLNSEILLQTFRIPHTSNELCARTERSFGLRDLGRAFSTADPFSFGDAPQTVAARRRGDPPRQTAVHELASNGRGEQCGQGSGII